MGSNASDNYNLLADFLRNVLLRSFDAIGLTMSDLCAQASSLWTMRITSPDRCSDTSGWPPTNQRNPEASSWLVAYVSRPCVGWLRKKEPVVELVEIVALVLKGRNPPTFPRISVLALGLGLGWLRNRSKITPEYTLDLAIPQAWQLVQRNNQRRAFRLVTRLVMKPTVGWLRTD